MKRLYPAKALPVRPITVLLAEDNVSFRKSVKALIEADGDFEVVGEAKDGREAVGLSLGLLLSSKGNPIQVRSNHGM